MIYYNIKTATAKSVPTLVAVHVFRLDAYTTIESLKRLLNDEYSKATDEEITFKYSNYYKSFKVCILADA